MDEVVLFHLRVEFLSEHSTKAFITATHKLLGNHSLVTVVLISLFVNVNINLLEILFTLQFSLSTSALLSSLELLLHLVEFFGLLFVKFLVDRTLSSLVSS